METEQALSMAESLAEKEILFLQEEKYDHAFKLAEKRKEIFSRLEKEELSPVTGIKKNCTACKQFREKLRRVGYEC